MIDGILMDSGSEVGPFCLQKRSRWFVGECKIQREQGICFFV